MQQQFRRLALFIGATSIVGAGLIMVACGTDNGNPVATPSVDSGKTDGGGVKTDGSVDPGQDGATPDSGVDADCPNNPILRDNTAGFRCAFQDGGGAEGGAPNCTNTQSCCNTESKATGPGYCAEGKGDQACNASPPPGSTFTVGKAKAWECADNSACAGSAGKICCMITDPAQVALDPKNAVNIGKTLASDTRHPAACNVARVFKEGGSRCKTACDPAKDLRLCSTTDPCGAGTVCTPFVDFTNFVDRGYCK